MPKYWGHKCKYWAMNAISSNKYNNNNILLHQKSGENSTFNFTEYNKHARIIMECKPNEA